MRPGAASSPIRCSGPRSSTSSTSPRGRATAAACTVPVLFDTQRRPHRQQRVVGNHPHVQFGVRRRRRQSGRLLSRRAARGDRRAQRAHLPDRQQRRLSLRLRAQPAGLRRSGRRAVRVARWARGAARRPPLPVRRAGDRSGLAAVHDAGALRSGLCRPVQMQRAPHRRLSQPQPLSQGSARLGRASRRRSTISTSSIIITRA